MLALVDREDNKNNRPRQQQLLLQSVSNNSIKQKRGTEAEGEEQQLRR